MRSEYAERRDVDAENNIFAVYTFTTLEFLIFSFV